MTKRLIFLIALIISINLISLRSIYSFFSDTAQSTNNTFVAADVFPTTTSTVTPTSSPAPTQSPTPTPTGANIVINEVSSSGGISDEWVELFNPTTSSIDVSGWKIEDNTSEDTFPTTSPIPAGGYGVVIPDSSTVSGSIPSSAIVIQLTGATIGNGLANEGDMVKLKDPLNVVVDAVSYGDNTSIFTTPPLAPSSGESLARSPNGFDTDTAADWVIDSAPTIGVVNN